jgi:hypothetical protein
MPRIVRNFWIELLVDGKVTKVSTGPKGGGGGFTMKILQRSAGEVHTAFSIEGAAMGRGAGRSDTDLVVSVQDEFGSCMTCETKRDSVGKSCHRSKIHGMDADKILGIDIFRRFMLYAKHFTDEELGGFAAEIQLSRI